MRDDITGWLTNRHILVTGASSGIGQATAVLLARRGARVTLVARRAPELQETVRHITDSGGLATFAVADVAAQAQLLDAIDTAENHFGPVDGAFLNAGVGGPTGPFAACDDECWSNVLTTNVTSAFWAIRKIVPGMMQRKSGSVVMIGSLASERGMASHVAYVTAKHAVLGLARAIALEAASANVRVNCVLPGVIDTPMFSSLTSQDGKAALVAAMERLIPQKRLGTAAEVAEVVAFLLSDASSHVTGQAWAVDGGMLGTLSLGS